MGVIKLEIDIRISVRKIDTYLDTDSSFLLQKFRSYLPLNLHNLKQNSD